MKSTVYCYDRFATHKRFATAAFALLAAGAALLIATPSEAATKIERLPTVVVTGKAFKLVRLPTVVVEGRSQRAPVMAAEEPREPEMKRVAFIQPARY